MQFDKKELNCTHKCITYKTADNVDITSSHKQFYMTIVTSRQVEQDSIGNQDLLT